MNETGRSKRYSQGHPSWEPQGTARSGQYKATRQPTPFRTQIHTAVLGGSSAMSWSFSFQGVTNTVLSASSVPRPLERSCASGDQGVGKRERKEADGLAEAAEATWVIGRGPGHPPHAEPTSSFQRLSSGPTLWRWLVGSPTPARAQEGWASGGYLLHCTLSKPVAALFSSSVVFCSCMEVPPANSGSLLRSMITISISGSKHRSQDEPRQLPTPRVTDIRMFETQPH